MEICSLKDVENKIIGTLSKGYRQRVGLADALVNKPDLLILDEPTNGLDPQQIRHFRELIKDLGKRHTIFLSTHILPEVEMTCGRVLIIHRGKLLASDTPQGLVRRRLEGGDLVVELDANPGKASVALKKLKGVTSVDEERNVAGWVRYKIASKGSPDLSEKIFELAVERKWKIREMSRRDVTLEDAFVDLVKGEGAA